jgi:predicted Zn-dependent protease with MMP-like domain
MSRNDRLLALCDRGVQALTDGDLDAASRAFEQARRIDGKHVEVIALGASIAATEGDFARAIEGFEQVIEQVPDEPMPWLNAAGAMFSSGDLEGALVKIDGALERIDEENDLIDAILLRAEILIGLERDADALTCLGELATSAIEDAGTQLAIAELTFAAGDLRGALSWCERALGDAELGTDALHLAGGVHGALGDEAARMRCWLEVRARDAATPDPDWHLSHEDFEKLAAVALEELPPRAQELLKDVPILIDDLPAPGLIEDGFDPRALGMIDGPNLREQAVEGRGAAPVNIFLYQKNLELAFDDPEELAEQIRITVLHETAHYFGLDEDEVADVGLE